MGGGLPPRAHELETRIARIRTDIQADGNPERRPLLMSELQKALRRMDDLKRQLDEVRSPAAAFFFVLIASPACYYVERRAAHYEPHAVRMSYEV
jgi:hypothetical protein